MYIIFTPRRPHSSDSNQCTRRAPPSGTRGQSHQGAHGDQRRTEGDPTHPSEEVISIICIRLIHCAHDHLLGLAGVLLYTEVSIRSGQRQNSGEWKVSFILNLFLWKTFILGLEEWKTTKPFCSEWLRCHLCYTGLVNSCYPQARGRTNAVEKKSWFYYLK